MHLLWTCIIGLVVGAIAKLLVPGKDPGGWIVTMLLGICGALLAGWIGRSVGHYQPGQGAGFLASIVGAVIILFCYHLLRRWTHHEELPH